MDPHQEKRTRARRHSRGPLPLTGRLDRKADRALSAQLDLTRMLYGAHGR